MTDTDAAKQRAREGVTAAADKLIEVSRQIHSNPELAMEERKAAGDGKVEVRAAADLLCRDVSLQAQVTLQPRSPSHSNLGRVRRRSCIIAPQTYTRYAYAHSTHRRSHPHARRRDRCGAVVMAGVLILEVGVG